jgi:hypothetical protein
MLLNNQALVVPETFTVLDIFRSEEGATPPLQYAFQSHVFLGTRSLGRVCHKGSQEAFSPVRESTPFSLIL